MSENDESAYRVEIKQLINRCKFTYLDKTKEKVVDYKGTLGNNSSLNISRSYMKIMRYIKFLYVHLSDDIAKTSTSFAGR